MTTTTHTERPRPDGTLRAAWRAAHRPVADVPRWAVISAAIIPLLTVPSSLWRISAGALHLPIVDRLPAQTSGDLPSWLPLELWVIVLSVVSELVAFTAVGLVARWGEVYPHWIPGLGGRMVRPLAAVIPAMLGAITLTLLSTVVLINSAQGLTIRGTPQPTTNPFTFDTWRGCMAIAAYAPLLAWGPLLGAVTVAYYRRRAGRTAESA